MVRGKGGQIWMFVQKNTLLVCGSQISVSHRLSEHGGQCYNWNQYIYFGGSGWCDDFDCFDYKNTPGLMEGSEKDG